MLKKRSGGLSPLGHGFANQNGYIMLNLPTRTEA